MATHEPEQISTSQHAKTVFWVETGLANFANFRSHRNSGLKPAVNDDNYLNMALKEDTRPSQTAKHVPKVTIFFNFIAQGCFFVFGEY